MSNFQWQTDAEDSWEEKIVVPPTPKPPPLRRYGWVLALVMALVGAGSVLYWQVHQQVEAATTAVTGDVTSSHNLLQRAIIEQDEDLFTVLLSGRDLDWTKAQQSLLQFDSVRHRPSFGLYALAAEPPTYEETEQAVESVEVTADLLSAELVSRHIYTATLPDGRLEFVTLRQTAVYRRGDERWLYAPPDDEFWGTTETDTIDKLTLTFPQRDETLVIQLAIDLAYLLHDMCSTLADIACPDNLPVILVFSPDPDSLVNLNEPRTLWQSGLRVVLPTPTLVGLPANDAAYDVLFQGYARQVATAVITHLVDWECCIGAPFYQALLDYQLAQLNLLPWPVTRADYQRVVAEGISLNQLSNYWRVDSPTDVPVDIRWLVYTAADFLLQTTPGISAAIAQRSINEWRSLYPWLEDYVLNESDQTIAPTDIDRRWLTMAEIQARLSNSPPPIPLPAQDIQLLCHQPAGDNVAGIDGTILYRYRLAGEEWVEELVLNDYSLMSVVPDDTAVLLQSLNTSLNTNETEPPYFMVWQDGEVRQRVQISGEYTLSFGQFLPGNGRVIAYTFDEETDVILSHVVDLAQCEEESCASQVMPGLHSWSPSGTQLIQAEPAPAFFNHMILVDGRAILLNGRSSDQPAYTLFRTTNSGERIDIGEGFDPFWIDEETYGYLHPVTENSLEVVVSKTADDTSQTLFNSDYLLTQLPDFITPASFTINYILVSPHDPTQLFIVTTTSRQMNTNTAYIFSYSLSSHQLSLRVQSTYLGILVVGFSPNGRYLIVNGWHEGGPTAPGGLNTMFLYDLNDGSSDSFITTFPAVFPAHLYDWSVDGQWLAIIVDEHTIALTLPDQNYYQIIRHEFGACTSLAWVNR